VTPIEREYSPSSRVANLDDELARYREASDQAVRLPHQVVPTGDRPDEFAVVFDPAGAVFDSAGAADGPAERLHVFIHGGYWQALSAWDSLAPAPACVAAGSAFAAINYTLAPEATIATMIDQCTAALDVLVHRFPAVVVTLSGSSAGAHLAAQVALRRPETVDRLLLASGVYDLTPLVQTYVNEPLGLDDASARALSVHAPRPPDVQVLVVYGDNETDAFKAQSARLAAAWAAPVVEVVGRHHFDLVFDLAALDQRHDLWPAHGREPVTSRGAAAVPASGRRVAVRRVAAESLRPLAAS
jgi:arylformamidase